jgi:hypothetical protein
MSRRGRPELNGAHRLPAIPRRVDEPDPTGQSAALKMAMPAAQYMPVPNEPA